MSEGSEYMLMQWYNEHVREINLGNWWCRECTCENKLKYSGTIRANSLSDRVMNESNCLIVCYLNKRFTELQNIPAIITLRC